MTQAQAKDNITLAPGVIDTIISITVGDMEGVASLGDPVVSGIFTKLANKPSTSGIESRRDEDNKLEVTLHITAKYGYALPQLAADIRQAVADALRVQVGVEVASVDIFVDSISFDQN